MTPNCGVVDAHNQEGQNRPFHKDSESLLNQRKLSNGLQSNLKVDAPEFVPKSQQPQSGSFSRKIPHFSNSNQSRRNFTFGGTRNSKNEPSGRKTYNEVTTSDLQSRFYSSLNIEEQLFNSKDKMKTGIDFDDYDNIPVESSGREVPNPISSFEESSLHPKLLANVKRASYLKPTPIQKHAIPVTIASRDIMACAQTGSGKTAAFLFPIIHHLMQNKSQEFHIQGKACPEALVVAPTRELATQIFKEALKFTFKSSVFVVVVYGGASIQRQIEQIESRNCNICVATPGRLLDLTQRGYVSFKNLKHFVLDEADRMLDMGFEPQIRQICASFDFPAKENRTTSMFSATFPVEIQKLAGDFLSDYVFITVGQVGGAAKNVKQSFSFVAQDVYQMKRQALVQDLYKFDQERNQNNHSIGLKLIFVETKKKCDKLCNELRDFYRFRCVSIHGDRSQGQRERALRLFSSRAVDIMIATDVASRGLDIPNVEQVINFDLPNDIESYVHRIGRTGRAGNVGFANALVTPNDSKLAGSLVKILQDAEQVVPEWLQKLAILAPKLRKKKGNKYGARDYRNYERFQSNNSLQGQLQPIMYSAYSASSSMMVQNGQQLNQHFLQSQMNFGANSNYQMAPQFQMQQPYFDGQVKFSNGKVKENK